MNQAWPFSGQSLPLRRIRSGCWVCKTSMCRRRQKRAKRGLCVIVRGYDFLLKTRIRVAEIETQGEEVEMPLSAASLGCRATVPSAPREGGSTLARRITPLNTKSWRAVCIRRRRARISFPVLVSRPLCDSIRITRSQGPNRAAGQTH